MEIVGIHSVEAEHRHGTESAYMYQLHPVAKSLHPLVILVLEHL